MSQEISVNFDSCVQHSLPLVSRSRRSAKGQTLWFSSILFLVFDFSKSRGFREDRRDCWWYEKSSDTLVPSRFPLMSGLNRSVFHFRGRANLFMNSFLYRWEQPNFAEVASLSEDRAAEQLAKRICTHLCQPRVLPSSKHRCSSFRSDRR